MTTDQSETTNGGGTEDSHDSNDAYPPSGAMVDGRFRIERRVASGAVGQVFRAYDESVGEPVALKLMRSESDTASKRFDREVGVLSRIEHPGIVRYVAHGDAGEGLSYVAMEWLEGCTLEDRLRTELLTPRETLDLARSVAEGLSAIHAQGIVHRDLKPANIFLVGGHLTRARLIDFGIVKVRDVQRITRVGLTVGTPNYMAPEQARGDAVGPAADIFSFGSVLYRSVAGRTPFESRDVLNTMLRIILDPTPSLRWALPEAPAWLDAFLAKLIAKDPAERPRDGAALLALAERVREEHDPADDLTQASPTLEMVEPDTDVKSVPPAQLSERERRLLSVILIGRPLQLGDRRASPAGATTQRRVRELKGVVAKFGAHMEGVLDGTLVATLAGTGVARDQVGRAAQCALHLRSLIADRPMVLATGRAETGGPLPVGEVVDRAVELLSEETRRQTQPPDEARVNEISSPLCIDAVTAGLLDARFEIGGDTQSLHLTGMLGGSSPWSLPGETLLPWLGRKLETQTLAQAVDAAFRTGEARAVLVRGEAGIGKSRLLGEALGAKLDEGLRVLSGRTSSLRTEPYGPLLDAIRSDAGIREGDATEVAQRKLVARVQAAVDESAQTRVAQYVAELLGIGFESDDDALAAARASPSLMGDQIRFALRDYVASQCQGSPLLLVLEDMHWCDAATIEFLQYALLDLRSSPLALVMTSRPQDDVDRRIASQIKPRIIDLGPLSRGDAQRAAREALERAGRNRDRQKIAARIARYSEGHPLLLEELVLAAREGGKLTAPDSVMAFLQARLERLDAEQRRILRAGSVFGRTFTPPGVAALLGIDEPSALAAHLESLTEQGVLARDTSHSGHPTPHVFRHGLLCDAAYRMLTKEDRKAGHRLAAEYLEATRYPEPSVIAGHAELGGHRELAVRWYRRAAERALEANDMRSAARLAERGIENGAKGVDFGAMSALLAEAFAWRGKNDLAYNAARSALTVLTKGSELWCTSIAEAALAATRLGRRDEALELGKLVLSEIAQGNGSRALYIAAARIGEQHYLLGLGDMGQKLLDHVEAAARLDAAPALSARLCMLRAWGAIARGAPADAVRYYEAAAAEFDAVGDTRSATLSRINAGCERKEFGHYEEAEASFREALEQASRRGMAHLVGGAQHNLGYVLAQIGEAEEGRELERAALKTFIVQNNKRLEIGCRVYLALILVRTGELDDAEREARAATDAVGVSDGMRVFGRAALAKVLLERALPHDALRVAEPAVQSIETQGEPEEGATLLRLAYAEALWESGRREPARRAIASAAARLRERATRIDHPAWKASFLGRVVENARTLELADAWK